MYLHQYLEWHFSLVTYHYREVLGFLFLFLV